MVQVTVAAVVSRETWVAQLTQPSPICIIIIYLCRHFGLLPFWFVLTIILPYIQHKYLSPFSPMFVAVLTRLVVVLVNRRFGFVAILTSDYGGHASISMY